MRRVAQTTRTKRARRPRARGAAPLPQPPQPPRGADVTREKLLQATHELLLERAGAEPSVSQICERAGVQVAMVSYCFGGKAGLFDALVERTSEGVRKELERLTDAELDAEEKLRRHVAAVIRNFVRFPYVTQFSERQARQGGAVQLAEIVGRPMLAFYRELLPAGAAEGSFREVDATLLFFSIVGMCEFLFAARSWLEGAGETVDEALIERFTDHTVELVLHGIGTRDAP
jgi:AcrR family transcriptional regulator